MIPEFTDGYFKIDSIRGFLPIQEPLKKLPHNYQTLQNILDQIPNYIQSCIDMEPAVKQLPNYLESIKQESDLFLIAALYRGYCFLSSAFILYPAHIHFIEKKEYGIARNKLCENLSQPLLYLAERLNVYPWLEYSYGYSLGNYVKIDPLGGLDYTNLKMANSFTGSSDETGFIMVHVDINQHTPDLIKDSNQILSCFKDNTNPCQALESILTTLVAMNNSRRKMWDASRWENYNDFRVFIMGIEGNKKIFPHGLVYEPETEPRYYRGQSGSQDSIIPFLDNFFRVCDYYPQNDLTNYLMDMRNYRPKPFRDLLEFIKEASTGLVEWILLFPNLWITLFKIYIEIYNFRNGHWQFVQKYIMSTTKYPIATGGTPIISWLPNQIFATLDAINFVLTNVKDEENPDFIFHYNEYKTMRELIEKQVDILKNLNYQPNQVFEMNKLYKKLDQV
jgi:indoleamine 2,3-dioxygenase